MYRLIVHDDATADLRRMMMEDRDAAIRMGRFIQQLQADQELLDRLTQTTYGGRPNAPRPPSALFNVGMWRAAQDAGYNLWRLRGYFAEGLPYRLIYAFTPPGLYVLLAVVEKAAYGADGDARFNYELSHPVAERVMRALDHLDD